MIPPIENNLQYIYKQNHFIVLYTFNTNLNFEKKKEPQSCKMENKKFTCQQNETWFVMEIAGVIVGS